MATANWVLVEQGNCLSVFFVSVVIEAILDYDNDNDNDNVKDKSCERSEPRLVLVVGRARQDAAGPL